MGATARATRCRWRGSIPSRSPWGGSTFAKARSASVRGWSRSPLREAQLVVVPWDELPTWRHAGSTSRRVHCRRVHCRRVHCRRVRAAPGVRKRGGAARPASRAARWSAASQTAALVAPNRLFRVLPQPMPPGRPGRLALSCHGDDAISDSDCVCKCMGMGHGACIVYCLSTVRTHYLTYTVWIAGNKKTNISDPLAIFLTHLIIKAALRCTPQSSIHNPVAKQDPGPCQDRVLALTTSKNLLFSNSFNSIFLSSEGTGLWNVEKCFNVS
jgi:hypothetical protein